MSSTKVQSRFMSPASKRVTVSPRAMRSVTMKGIMSGLARGP
ncbi:MAG: hypothetical protein R3C45_21905 [Phycisphaerales bacterium]